MKAFVTSVFKSKVEAHDAVDKLLRVGFTQPDVSVLMTEPTRAREFGVAKETKAPEGAAAGAATGGVLGAIVAGLLAVGSIAIPGGVLITGPLVAALAGAGVGGAAGTLLGGLIGAGIPEHEAKVIAEGVREGGILVGVHAEGEGLSLARQILKMSGGESIKTETLRT